MDILVVDHERSQGSLLIRALRKLGHRAALCADLVGAVDRMRERRFDAVVTSLELSDITGLDLVATLRTLRGDLPVGFWGGRGDSDLLYRASLLGPVLPRVWTVADVRAMVNGMARRRAQFARGSQLVPALSTGVTQPAASNRDSRLRGAMRKIKLSCNTWDQVRRLCDDQSSGRNYLTVPATADMKRGDAVMVALRLPDELVLSIDAEVAGVRRDPVTDRLQASVFLNGLSPEMCTRMRAMCIGSSGGLRFSTYSKTPPRHSKKFPPGGPPPEQSSGQAIGVLRPRKPEPSDDS